MRTFTSIPRPPLRSTLLPYTTLFRSVHPETRGRERHEQHGVERQRRTAVQPQNGSEHREIPEQRLGVRQRARSEEHTSELQSHSDLVCRLLLEKKKEKEIQYYVKDFS